MMKTKEILVRTAGHCFAGPHYTAPIRMVLSITKTPGLGVRDLLVKMVKVNSPCVAGGESIKDSGKCDSSFATPPTTPGLGLGTK
jgi:hypothetical protein